MPIVLQSNSKKKSQCTYKLLLMITLLSTGRLYLKKEVSPKLVFISVLFHTSTLRSAILFFSNLIVHAVDR